MVNKNLRSVCIQLDILHTYLIFFFVWSYVGQSQMVELPNNPRGQAPTTSVDGLSNNSEYYARPYHKRSAVAPPSGAHWVQRQKMSHPTTTHHSMPIRFPTKPAASVTANLAHPSIPIYQSQSQTQQPVRALMNPSIPYTWIFCLVVLVIIVSSKFSDSKF